MPFDEISLTRRVLNLRETCADGEEFAARLRRDLQFSEAESQAVARVLEDRFVSQSESLDLLGNLELGRTLAEGSTVGGFIHRLAGPDGREAERNHARALADRMAPRIADGERPPMDSDAIRELAAFLPRPGLVAGAFSPVTYGIYSYLRPRDSALVALAAEIRGNWETSRDPILRLRSARVLAEAGDGEAAAFLRESEAACSRSYRGDLGIDERLFRAAGLAIDGHAGAARLLQNVAMDPRETVARRTFALDYLPPSSLENGSDTAEVFRSLVEDPEEPVPTRYYMLSLLARSANPPDSAWWRRLLTDPTMRVNDRPAGSTAPSSARGYSEWNLVVSALASSSTEFASGMLREILYDRAAPLTARREALTAYLDRSDRGSLSWDVLREIMALPSGEWDGILTEVSDGIRPLRLRLPRATSPLSEPGREDDGREVVLELRQGGSEGWEVEFRPVDPAHDRRVTTAEVSVTESYLPANRRLGLGGITAREIASEVVVSNATPIGFSSGTSSGAASGASSGIPSGPSSGASSGSNATPSPGGSRQNATVGGIAEGI